MERTQTITPLAEVRDLATIPVWHQDPSRPSACTVLGISRWLGYRMAEDGRLPCIRLGSRIAVRVPALLAMLGETDPAAESQAL